MTITSDLELPIEDAKDKRIAKLEHENHELRRTRSEAEAQARIDGYQEGQRDLRRDINALLGRS
jgi:flagellar biosynthesis/type III secretory pathway protein FliH